MKKIIITVSAIMPDNSVSFNITIEHENNRHGGQVSGANIVNKDLFRKLQLYFDSRKLNFVHIQAIEDNIIRFGASLFNTLFKGPEMVEYSNLLANLEDCCLHIIDMPRSKAFIPWSILYNPATKKMVIAEVSEFAIFYGREQVITNPIEGTLNVLVATARPSGTDDVPLRSISNLLFKNYQANKDIRLTFLRRPTFQHFSTVLEEGHRNGLNFQIVHFDGHGIYEESNSSSDTTGRSFLVFESAHGDHPNNISGSDLGPVLANAGVRLFVMNACRSDYRNSSAQNGHERTLLEELNFYGIDAIVGMKFDIGILSAKKFVKVFYEKLFLGAQVSAAFHQGLVAMLKDQRKTQRSRFFDMIVPTLIVNADIRFSRRRTGLIKKIKLAASFWTEFYHNRFYEVLDDLVLQIDRAFQRTNVVHVYGCLGSGKTELSKSYGEWAQSTKFCEGATYISAKHYTRFNKVTQLLGHITLKKSHLLVFDDADDAHDAFWDEEILLNLKNIKILFMTRSGRLKSISKNVYRIQAALDFTASISLIENFIFEKKGLLDSVNLEILIKRSRGNFLMCIYFSHLLEQFFKRNILPSTLSNFLDFEISGFTLPKARINQFRNWFAKEELYLLLHLHVFGEYFSIEIVREVVRFLKIKVESLEFIGKLRDMGLLVEGLPGYAWKLHPYITPQLRSDFEKQELAEQNKFIEFINKFFFPKGVVISDPLLNKIVRENAAYICRCAIRQQFKQGLYLYLDVCKQDLPIKNEEWVDMVLKAYRLICTEPLSEDEKLLNLDFLVCNRVLITKHYVELCNYRLEFELTVETYKTLVYVAEVIFLDFETSSKLSDATRFTFLNLLFLYSETLQTLSAVVTETDLKRESLIELILRCFSEYCKYISSMDKASAKWDSALDRIAIQNAGLRGLQIMEFREWYANLCAKRRLFFNRQTTKSAKFADYFERMTEMMPADEVFISRSFFCQLSMLSNEEQTRRLIEQFDSFTPLETILGKNWLKHLEALLAFYTSTPVTGILQHQSLDHTTKRILKFIKVKMYFWVLKQEDLNLLLDVAIISNPDIFLYFVDTRIKELRSFRNSETDKLLEYSEFLYGSIDRWFPGASTTRFELDTELLTKALLKGQMNEAFSLYEQHFEVSDSPQEKLRVAILKINFLSFLYLVGDLDAQLLPYGTYLREYIEQEINRINDELLPVFKGSKDEKKQQYLRFQKSNSFKSNYLFRTSVIQISLENWNKVMSTLSDITLSLADHIKEDKYVFISTQKVWESVLRLTKMREDNDSSFWNSNREIQKHIFETEFLLLNCYCFLLFNQNQKFRWRELVTVTKYFIEMLKGNTRFTMMHFKTDEEMDVLTHEIDEKINALIHCVAVEIQSRFKNDDYSDPTFIIQCCDLIIDFFQGGEIKLDKISDLDYGVDKWNKEFIISQKAKYLLYLLHASLTENISKKTVENALRNIESIKKLYAAAQLDNLSIIPSSTLTFHDYKVYWYYQLICGVAPEIITKMGVGEMDDVVKTLKKEIDKPQSIMFEHLKINREEFSNHIHRIGYFNGENYKKLTEEWSAKLGIVFENVTEKILDC